MNDAPYVYRAKLIRVIDGDTIVATIDLGFHIFYEQHLRLAHINAPEHDKAATDYLKSITPAEFTIQSYKPLKEDKYGRYLVDLWVDGATISINQMMLNASMAVPYEGGAR